MDKQTSKLLKDISFVSGFGSIIASIAVWAAAKGETPEEKAHGERFGIFIGLWAPTFFILSDWFGRQAKGE